VQRVLRLSSLRPSSPGQPSWQVLRLRVQLERRVPLPSSLLPSWLEQPSWQVLRVQLLSLGLVLLLLLFSWPPRDPPNRANLMAVSRWHRAITLKLPHRNLSLTGLPTMAGGSDFDLVHQ